MKVSLGWLLPAVAVATAPAPVVPTVNGTAGRRTPAVGGPDWDLRHDGEVLFCDAIAVTDTDLGDIGGNECRRSWRYAVSASCSPVCRAYDLGQQQQREGHVSLYARETCEQRGRSACMATCVADQLIATGGTFDPVKDRDSVDFISSLIFSYGDSAKPETVAWFANITDAVKVTGRNATVLGDDDAKQASDSLSGFWEEVCASGGETRFGAAFCIDEFKDTKDSSANVHFAYLDEPKETKDPTANIHFAYLDGLSAPSFLQRQTSPRVGGAALRRASRVESKTGVDSVRRWLEATFLREGHRVAHCSEQ